jgi:hypothetical protein
MKKAESNWRDGILASFTPEIAAVARLTVVCDPDHLLAEEGVIEDRAPQQLILPRHGPRSTRNHGHGEGGIGG